MSCICSQCLVYVVINLGHEKKARRNLVTELYFLTF